MNSGFGPVSEAHLTAHDGVGPNASRAGSGNVLKFRPVQASNTDTSRN